MMMMMMMMKMMMMMMVVVRMVMIMVMLMTDVIVMLAMSLQDPRSSPTARVCGTAPFGDLFLRACHAGTISGRLLLGPSDRHGGLLRVSVPRCAAGQVGPLPTLPMPTDVYQAQSGSFFGGDPSATR
jgi:hypothetical protein